MTNVKGNTINYVTFQEHDHSNDHEVNDSIIDSSITITHIEVISSTNAFFALRDEWNVINDSSPKGGIFTSWEWLYTWWEVYKNDGNRQLYILIYKDQSNKIFGIAPFQIINNPKRYFPCSRQVVLLGTDETDGSFVFGEYMDLIITPTCELLAINAFSSFLMTHQSLWDGINFHELLGDSYLSRLFSHYPEKIIKKVTEKGFRTYINLPDTYNNYLMGLHKKMRSNINRTFTRLKTEQQYDIKTINTESEGDEAISILAELNRTRREDLGVSSSFEQPNFEEFHKKVIKRLLPLNKVKLRILSFSDKPVVAVYSFVDNETIHVYQSGFEVKHGQRYSLLTTMLTQEISKSIQDPSLKCLNFMYDDNENTYKRRYSGITEEMYEISYEKRGIRQKIYSVIHGPIKRGVKRLFFKAS